MVIKKGYELHDSYSPMEPNNLAGVEKELKARGEFVIAMREDLLGRKPVRKTKLKADDYKHLGSKRNPVSLADR